MKKKPSDYVGCFLKTPEGMMCKDGKLRSSVCFGTPNWTLKFWKSEGWAERAAERTRFREWTIIHVYERDTVHSDGHVERRSA